MNEFCYSVRAYISSHWRSRCPYILLQAVYCGNNTISSLVGYEKHTISFLVGGGHFNLVTVLRLLMSQWSWFCIYSIICVIPTQYNNTATLLSLQNIVTGGVGGGGAGHYRKSVKRSTLYHLLDDSCNFFLLKLKSSDHDHASLYW